MNKLSWLIYWADAAPHIANFICMIGFILFVITLILLVLGFTGFFGNEAEFNVAETCYDKRKFQYAHELGPRFRRLWPITLVSLCLWGGSFLVPSKNTFYLIAASEVGERVIQTPEFVKVRQILNHWLESQDAGEGVATNISTNTSSDNK